MTNLQGLPFEARELFDSAVEAFYDGIQTGHLHRLETGMLLMQQAREANLKSRVAGRQETLDSGI